MDLARVQHQFANLASHPVARAFAISLAFHLLVLGVFEVAYRAGWLPSAYAPSVLLAQQLQRTQVLPSELQALNQPDPDVQRELPIIFVEVDPSQEAPDAPEDTKFYSMRNSRAADAARDPKTDIPNIDGKQTQVLRTADRAPSKAAPLQPVAPPPQPQPEERQPDPEPKVAKQETKPEPVRPPVQPKPKEEPRPEPEPVKPNDEKPGDLAMAKPVQEVVQPAARPPMEKQPATEQKAATPNPTPAKQRPRRLADVKAPDPGLAGQKVKQDGGARRYSLSSSFDAKATPFGAYDWMIINAIQQRWYALLEERDYGRNFTGRVVLEFRLNSDGRVTEMRVLENGVSEILALICQRAVQDPAPFEPWPNDMRRMIGADYREVKFTFHYN